MEKKKIYRHTCFFPETVMEAVKLFYGKIKDDPITMRSAQTDKEVLYKSESIDEIIQNHGAKRMTVEIGDGSIAQY